MALSSPETLLNRPVDLLLRFSCPMCCTVLEIPCSRAGLEGPCPACGATIIAPSVVSVQPPQMVEVSPASQPNMESMGNEVDEAHAAALRRLVRDAMVEAQPLRVPLQVRLKQGASWGELSVVEEFVSQASQALFAFDGSQI